MMYLAVADCRYARDLAMAPRTGAPVYVANTNLGTVTPISTATNKALRAIRVGNTPSYIAITPDGKIAYVANAGADTVTPINTATDRDGPAITVGASPSNIAITPNGKTAYVLDGGNATGRRGCRIGIAKSRLVSRSHRPRLNFAQVCAQLTHQCRDVSRATAAGLRPFVYASPPILARGSREPWQQVDMQMRHGVTDDGSVDVVSPRDFAERTAGACRPPTHAACLGVSEVRKARRMSPWFDEQTA
jgi:YVTN family beta-propeller protein